MKLEEIKVGDVVRIEMGDFVSAYPMTVIAIKNGIALCEWKEFSGGEDDYDDNDEYDDEYEQSDSRIITKHIEVEVEKLVFAK